ncbi:MAG: hypothetical protein KF902_06040 [Phycisphaeraceae bacterium]|nr:hypothetical protein [Phycisphaeraceae bacterium]
MRKLFVNRLRSHIRAALSSPGRDYAITASMCHAIQAGVKQEFAAALAEPLNAELARMPTGTYEQKKDMAAFVNAQARPFGLAVKCPRSGSPGILQANTGNNPAVGRFRIEVLDELGHRRHHTSAVELPTIELTVDTGARVPHRHRGERGR